MNSKGFFITLAVFLFAIFLVSLIALYNSTISSYNAANPKLNKILQLSHQHNVFEKNYLQIFNSTNFRWITDSNKATFLLRIPDANNRLILRTRGKFFADLFHSSTIGLNSSINTNYFYCPSLRVMPYNIDINNSLCDANALYITPKNLGSFDVNSYVIDFNIHGQDFNELIENVTPCVGCEFPLNLKIIVRNALGTIEATSNNTIDANAYSEVIIKTTAPNESDFNISVFPLASLKFFNDSNSFADVNATIILNNAQNKPFITIPQNVITISDINFSIS